MSRVVIALVMGHAAGCAPRIAAGDELSSTRAAAAQTSRADVHVHLTMKHSLRPFQGEVDGAILATHPDQSWTNQITTAGYRAAGVRVMVATIWPPFEVRPGTSAMDDALGGLEALRRFTRERPGYAVARSAEHARALLAADVIAVFPHLEGAEAIRSVADVDTLFAAGYRAIGLVHFTDNGLADAHDGQFGPWLSPLLDGKDGALTPLGRDAVRRMFALGMLVDLSHCSERAREEILTLAEELQVPVLYSHAGSDWHVPRTLDDGHARRIAALGGVIGIGVYRHDLLMPLPSEDQLEDHVPTTCDDIVSHWRHYARVAGAQNVVLGSDLNSTIHRPRAGGRCANGIRHSGDLTALFAALEREGIPRATLDGSAERVLRLFEAVEAAATAQPSMTAPGRATPWDSPL